MSAPWCSGATRPIRRPACLRCSRRWPSSTFWSWLIRIRPCRPSCTTARTVSTCCLPRRSSRPPARSLHRTGRCSGVKRSSTRCSSRCRTMSIMQVRQEARFRRSILQTHLKVENDEPTHRGTDITLREINKGMWTIGYTGQSPERLKKHMANQHTFDKTDAAGPRRSGDGDYYGLPWPCWGTAEMGHPGTPNLYDPSKPVGEGGLCFRARFGVKAPDDWGGANMLAEGSYPVGSEIKDGYPEFTYGHAAEARLGWRSDRTAATNGPGDCRSAKSSTRSTGRPTCPAVSSGSPSSMAARRSATPRPVPWCGRSRIRCRCTANRSTRQGATSCRNTPPTRTGRCIVCRPSSPRFRRTTILKEYPIVLTSGRLVEYEGGGDESRSNPWLAELQQDMFVEINPVDANNLGIRNGEIRSG